MRRPLALALTLALAASMLGLLTVSASATAPGDTPDTGNFYVDPATFSQGQSVKLTANFPDGVFMVTFYKQTAPDTWTSIGTDESNSSGNAYLTNYQVNGTQDVYARITSGGPDGRTEVKTLTPEAITPSGPDTGNLTESPTTFKAGDLISVTANFPNGTFPITLFKEGPAGTWTAVATKTSSSSGNATFSGFPVTTATQRIFARKANNDRTEVDDIRPTPTVTLSIRRDCPANSCGSKATAYGELDPVQQGRTFKLQRLSGSKWSTVGSTATTDVNGELKIPFSVSGLSQWSARSFRLVSADATTPALTSNTIQFMPGPTQLGKNVLRVDVEKGVFPTSLGPEYTGMATLSVDGVVDPKLDHVALEKFGVRGNSSAKFAKKPYKLKFDKSPKNTTVFGMGADKSWTLLPNFIDQTFIRDKVGLDLGRQMTNIAWTPDSRFVEVFVNDQYRGLYTMTESVKIDNDRVDVDADTGMIMETDGADPEDPSIGFISTIGKIAFSFKDPDTRETLPDGTPDSETVTDQKMTLITDRVNAFEAKIYNASTRDEYPEWIDVEAAAEFYLLKEFTRDNDTDFYNSHYFSWDSAEDPLKPLADGKFHFGPGWDFDRSAGNVSDTDAHSKYVSSPVGWSMRGTGTPSGRPYYSTHWFVQLFRTSTFQDAVEERWLDLSDEFEKVHLNEVADLRSAIGVSAESDRKRWASEPKRYASRGTYDQEIAYVTKWYKDRYTWMDGQLSN